MPQHGHSMNWWAMPAATCKNLLDMAHDIVAGKTKDSFLTSKVNPFANDPRKPEVDVKEAACGGDPTQFKGHLIVVTSFNDVCKGYQGIPLEKLEPHILHAKRALTSETRSTSNRANDNQPSNGTNNRKHRSWAQKLKCR